VSFATAMTVLTLNIHHTGDSGREVPYLVKKLCFDCLARVLRIDVHAADEKEPQQQQQQVKLMEVSLVFRAPI
jgi:nicotinic acetylcholine receptor